MLFGKGVEHIYNGNIKSNEKPKSNPMTENAQQIKKMQMLNYFLTLTMTRNKKNKSFLVQKHKNL